MKVSELSHAKADLEARVEEDQDEIELLLEKQRTHISQTASLQSQLTEANFQVEELLEVKATMESKVSLRYVRMYRVGVTCLYRWRVCRTRYLSWRMV